MTPQRLARAERAAAQPAGHQPGQHRAARPVRRRAAGQAARDQRDAAAVAVRRYHRGRADPADRLIVDEGPAAITAGGPAGGGRGADAEQRLRDERGVPGSTGRTRAAAAYAPNGGLRALTVHAGPTGLTGRCGNGTLVRGPAPSSSPTAPTAPACRCPASRRPGTRRTAGPGQHDGRPRRLPRLRRLPRADSPASAGERRGRRGTGTRTGRPAGAGRLAGTGRRAGRLGHPHLRPDAAAERHGRYGAAAARRAGRQPRTARQRRGASGHRRPGYPARRT